MTEPGQEPPTVRDPFAPVPPPSSPPPPFYPPGSAAVPQQHPPQYAPQYPPPYQPVYPEYAGAAYTPPPKRNTGLIVGIIVGVLVLCLTGAIVGGALMFRTFSTEAGGQGGTPTPAVEPSSKVPGTTTPPTASVEKFTGDLRTLLVARPSGAKPWSDIKDTDGKLTVDEAANLFVDPGDVKTELNSFSFERGAVGHWTKSDVFVLILLFQFKSPSNARNYVIGQGTNGIEGYDHKGEFGSISGSVLFVDDTPDTDGQRSTIMMSSSGDIVSYVTVWHPGPIDLTMATNLAVQQHKRLPS